MQQLRREKSANEHQGSCLDDTPEHDTPERVILVRLTYRHPILPLQPTLPPPLLSQPPHPTCHPTTSYNLHDPALPHTLTLPPAPPYQFENSYLTLPPPGLPPRLLILPPNATPPPPHILPHHPTVPPDYAQPRPTTPLHPTNPTLPCHHPHPTLPIHVHQNLPLPQLPSQPLGDT